MKELIEAFLAHNHYKAVGPIETNQTMMPYLIMDIAYSIFMADINKRVTQFGVMNHWRKEWLREYKKFNDKFFDCFDKRLTTKAIAKMDEMEDFCADMVEELKEDFFTCLEGLPRDEVEVCGCCHLCASLTAAANVFYEAHFKIVGMPDKNIHLDRIRDASIMLAELYYTGARNISLNDSEIVNDGISKLCKRLIEFAKQKSQ